jgi:hypothetical protein
VIAAFRFHQGLHGEREGSKKEEGRSKNGANWTTQLRMNASTLRIDPESLSVSKTN